MRSLLIYGAPVWYTLLQKIERVQRSVSRVIYPDYGDDELLSLLCLPKLNSYIIDSCSKNFSKIENI